MRLRPGERLAERRPAVVRLRDTRTVRPPTLRGGLRSRRGRTRRAGGSSERGHGNRPPLDVKTQLSPYGRAVGGVVADVGGCVQSDASDNVVADRRSCVAIVLPCDLDRGEPGWNCEVDCCDGSLGGARRDEEKARAKERVYSFRDEFGQWDPKNQRPELWKIGRAHV